MTTRYLAAKRVLGHNERRAPHDPLKHFVAGLEVGHTRDGFALMWSGDDAPVLVHASSIKFPDLLRCYWTHRWTGMLRNHYDINEPQALSYIELRRLAQYISGSRSPGQWRMGGVVIADLCVRMPDFETTLNALLDASGILSPTMSVARREAARKQLELLKGRNPDPFVPSAFDADDLEVLIDGQMPRDLDSPLATQLLEFGWIQPEGRVLGVARAWASGSFDGPVPATAAEINRRAEQIHITQPDPLAELRAGLDRLDADAHSIGQPEGTLTTGQVRRLLGI